MSEMLGNHYFLVGNYLDAIKAYEKAFQDGLTNKILKKLIICHLAVDNFETAKILFTKLMVDEPLTLIKTDVSKEDYHCPELISEFESRFSSNSSIFDFIRLGILWLYCDADIGLKYFIKAKEKFPDNNFINDTIEKIKSTINQINQEVK